MKKYIQYIVASCIFLISASCDPEFERAIEDPGFYQAGEANFGTVIAVGNSLTAGFADGALYQLGQENSFPNILAKQIALIERSDFSQPLVADNIGGLILNGTQIADKRRVLTQDATGNLGTVKFIEGMPTTEVSTSLEGPFNNMGVPGAKSYHLLANGYGNVADIPTGTANPYFARFASTPNASILEDAVALDPTFFSLWIGNNDILSYATSGGIGTDQTGNLDASSYGPNDITDPSVFASIYQTVISTLTQNDVKGVVLNIPDVTSIPFFTTVPNNALVLSLENAANLTAAFQAVSGVFTQVLIQQGVSAPQAQAIAAQYAFTFNEGPNRLLIDVPVTDTNPLGIRQMSEKELLLLTIDQAALGQGYGSIILNDQVLQVLGLLQQGGTPNTEQTQTLLSAVSGIKDEDVLDSNELVAINTAQMAYNTTIQNLAMANNLAFFDVKSLLAQAASSGIMTDAGLITSTFATGGAFSLDGVHPTARGYAIVTNGVIDAINAQYESTIPKVNPSSFPTVYIE
ncbi:G-D-S-L family lipolytic protein [Spongiivirga sp. MCCC 1A20706]|uniref:G-D-S-L family lipolytic protein n=1 Tax=Spongiivirga sp. MCCC 1A20706 TaxID=3160963 RepID=UPI0039779D54